MREQWCIPEVSAEYVYRMEQLLDLYGKEYDEKKPVVCFDEKPCVLIGETRIPIPAKAGQLERYDYEYKRNGTKNLFGFFEPLAGQREMQITDQRTKVDFAHQMKTLVDVYYPEAVSIQLVMDNLNTHKLAVLYEVFPAEEAYRILSKINIYYTPKHASWLNQVEIEFSVLERQCLNRRIGSKEELISEIEAWTKDRNEQKAKVNWKFKVSDARNKLKRLYPVVN